MLRVGLVQHACTHDRHANLAATIDGIERAAAGGAQLVLLQELHRSLYFCQQEDPQQFELAETIPGETTTILGELSKALGIVIVGSLFEKRAAGIYHNTAVVLESDGSLAGIYRKMHIPDDPGYFEKYYFTPGDTGFNTIATSLGKLGVLVCWDQWYPEAARVTALLGADILFYPTAIGWHPAEKAEWGTAQVDAWRTAQRAHAIANGVFVAAPNRAGLELEAGTEGIEFFGHSFIADPFGRYLAQAETGDATLIATCDPALIESTRRNWPFLRDRRVDSYEPILTRWLGG